MRYAKPEYLVQEVNKAGLRLVTARDSFDVEDIDAIQIIDNWRAAHAYPAQTFYMALKRHANKVHAKALVAQRIKRLPSIIAKLAREDRMRLSQMQDIGGCRAVVKNAEQVRLLQSRIEGAQWGHEKLNPKDYIEHPKDSGYRSIHLKYKYTGAGNKADYSGLKIELQLRTMLQHRWATAVEAADTFTKQALKANRGRAEWARFFALMSSIYALRESTPIVPGTPSRHQDLVNEISDLDARFHMSAIFAGYAAIFPRVEQRKDATYFLLILDPVRRIARVRGFKRDESQQANAEYSSIEQSLASDSLTQVVLVSVSSVAALKRAYPNYFLDTKAFLNDLNRVLNIRSI